MRFSLFSDPRGRSILFWDSVISKELFKIADLFLSSVNYCLISYLGFCFVITVLFNTEVYRLIKLFLYAELPIYYLMISVFYLNSEIYRSIQPLLYAELTIYHFVLSVLYLLLQIYLMILLGFFSLITVFNYQ